MFSSNLFPYQIVRRVMCSWLVYGRNDSPSGCMLEDSEWVRGYACVWGVRRWRLWGLNKTPERIKWKSFCCNHAAVLDLAAWLMKEAERCSVERNYWVAASKREELQLIAPPTTRLPPPPHLLLFQSERERESTGCNKGNLIEYLQYLIEVDY